MKTVNQLLETKGHDVWSIKPNAAVYEVIEQMSEKGVGALAVMEDGRFVGIVSERDCARKVFLKGLPPREVMVKDIMTTHVIYAHLDHTVEECMAVMTEKRVRHLPVMDEKKLVGMVSIGDLVKAIIDEQQFTIEQLEHYISS